MENRKRKVFETEDKHYSHGEAGNYNIKIMRVSRWIRIDTICITEKSRLWDYADSCTEENGKRLLSVFRYNNRLYALSQFMRLYSPIFFVDETGEKSFLSGYNYTDYYYPLEIEINPDGEYIRLYRELKENEYKENGGIY